MNSETTINLIAIGAYVLVTIFAFRLGFRLFAWLFERLANLILSRLLPSNDPKAEEEADKAFHAAVGKFNSHPARLKSCVLILGAFFLFMYGFRIYTKFETSDFPSLNDSNGTQIIGGLIVVILVLQNVVADTYKAKPSAYSPDAPAQVLSWKQITVTYIIVSAVVSLAWLIPITPFL